MCNGNPQLEQLVAWGYLQPDCNVSITGWVSNGCMITILLTTILYCVNICRRRNRSADNTAPKGKVALIFSDVESSTKLWEMDENMMHLALELHNNLLRELIKQYGGYEVKTEGDAFMVSFKSALSAITFCMAAQLELLELDWPEQLLDAEAGGTTLDTHGNIIFCGLRIRMGGHFGEPRCQVDEVTRRMDYFGPVVNKAARVASLSNGGQITVTREMTRRAQNELRSAKIFRRFRKNYIPFAIHDHGTFPLKGIDGETTVIEVQPEELKERGWKPINKPDDKKEDPKTFFDSTGAAHQTHTFTSMVNATKALEAMQGMHGMQMMPGMMTMPMMGGQGYNAYPPQQYQNAYSPTPPRTPTPNQQRDPTRNGSVSSQLPGSPASSHPGANVPVTPNPQFVQTLIGMGYNEEDCKAAVAHTRNTGVDAALNHLKRSGSVASGGSRRSSPSRPTIQRTQSGGRPGGGPPSLRSAASQVGLLNSVFRGRASTVGPVGSPGTISTFYSLIKTART